MPAPALIPLLALLPALSGCEVDSFFDPSKTGRFEHTPTTIPVLERIDAIERPDEAFANATSVRPEDLLPLDVVYRIASGDIVTVEIPGLMTEGLMWVATRRIDASGFFRMPTPIGDVRAAGLTAEEFQNKIAELVDERVMRNPLVNVAIEEGGAFTFSIYGAVTGQGLYSLRRSDFRLLSALAQAGGVPPNTQRVYVIRQIPLTDEATFQPARREPDRRRGRGPVDIEELIEQMEEDDGGGDRAPRPDEPSPQAAPPPDIEALIEELAPDPDEAPPGGSDGRPDAGEAEDEEPRAGILPGAFGQEAGPPLDVDELEPVGPPPAPPQPEDEPEPADRISPPEPRWRTYIYLEDRDEWVPAPPEAPQRGPAAEAPPAEDADQPLFVERIIEVPYQKLKRGDSSYNLVIRPGDAIYVQERELGVVYIDGEVTRPGVFNLPTTGRITLSRLVAAAGGTGPLAFPSRVDLTRVVGRNREATIRLNLAAIRQKTEPDLYLRPDDHILVGTSFMATPMAVFRNGLRATYGFGFLLDRNFGNDVFGPPPVNLRGQ